MNALAHSEVGTSKLYIEQDYGRYSVQDHDTWSRLYSRLLPRWERFANERFPKNPKGAFIVVLSPEELQILRALLMPACRHVGREVGPCDHCGTSEAAQ